MSRLNQEVLAKLRQQGRVVERKRKARPTAPAPAALATQQQVRIHAKFPTLNQVIGDTKRHWSQYAGKKNQYTNLVAQQVAHLHPMAGPVRLVFTWYWPNRRSDPDNIAYAQKYVLDGLVQARVIPGDGWNVIRELVHRFEIDSAGGPYLDLSIATAK